MELVAFLGSDESTYGQATALINRMECERIILVKDKSTGNPFKNPNCKVVDVNSSQDLASLKKEMQEKLAKELSGDFEVALSIASGNGKEHMALISGLLSIPVGIKFVAFTKNGVEFIS